MSYLKLGDTRVIAFSTCNSAGALTNADALPVVVVRDNGSDMGYAPVVTNVSAGRYEVTIVGSSGNGFTAGHHYSVWVFTNMNTVSIGDGIGTFNVKTTDTDDLATATALASIQTDTTSLLGRLTALRAGYLDNLSAGSVSTAAALATAEADITTLLGRLTALRAGYLDNLSAGAVALASTLPAALVGGKMDSHVNDIAANAITAAAIADASIDRATFAQDALDLFGDRRRNTATAGAASTITLDAGASAVTDFYKNALIVIVGGTGIGQFRAITGYVGGTKVATVDRAWSTNPDATSVFEIFAAGATADATTVAGAVWNAVRASYVTAGTFGEGVAVKTIATDAVTAASLKADAITKMGSQVVEGSATRDDILRAIVSAVLHKVTDFRTGTYQFKSQDGSKIRWTVVADASGRITSTPGDLTP